MLIPHRANPGDFEDFFILRKDPMNVYWSGHTGPPDERYLREWFHSQLANDDRVVFLFYVRYAVAGYLYIDSILEADEHELSYGVLSSLSGNGYGTEIVNFGLKWLRKNGFSGTVVAWVSKQNIASKKCLTKNGFVATGDTKLRSFGNSSLSFEKLSTDIMR